MDPQLRKAVQDALVHVRERYIFPDKAADATALVTRRLAAGEYDGDDVDSVIAAVNADLLSVCADKHLRLLVRDDEMQDAATPEEELAAGNEAHRLANYRIARAERLDGNVGYLDLRGVPSPDISAPAVAAAMELVAHTGALVIDLRRNRGGDPDGVQHWHSYFFAGSETLLNTIYASDTGETRQYWTLPHVPGRRYLDRPVYLLTSDLTFSAGEEFAYNLQALRRATVVGETTRGGAHPSEWFTVSTTLQVSVPVARSVNPVTRTNWEGVGVVPDVPVRAADAFDVAYRRALEHVIAAASSPTVRAEAAAALDGLG
jgi:C-terminal processing protease CtpA/Prc